MNAFHRYTTITASGERHKWKSFPLWGMGSCLLSILGVTETYYRGIICTREPNASVRRVVVDYVTTAQSSH